MYFLIYYICIAYIIDLMIGDPYWLPHPICSIGNLISKTEAFFRKRVDKVITINKEKSEKIAGFFLVVIVVIVVFSIVGGALYVSKMLGVWFHGIVSVYLLFSCLATRCLANEAKKVYYALEKGDLKGARIMLSYLVGRETSHLSQEEVIRATVETVAENIVDGIIAPMFYGFIGGGVGSFIYKSINTMDSMVGYKNDKYINFGYAAAKLDDVVNYIPARITGFMIPIAAGLLRFDLVQSYKIMWRDRHNHKSPNCAYPEAAAAGALGIQLGGPNIYFGHQVDKPTIGDKVKALEIQDILHTIKIAYMASFLVLILFISIYVSALIIM